MKHFSTFGRALLLLACYQLAPARAQAQSIGVGTTKPSANAALDVYSTNKGLMFPRVDTAAVANPSAGLLIYSQQLKAPAYHNGNRWTTLAGGAAAATGPAAAAGLQAPSSISYTIDSGNGIVTTGTFTSIVSMSNGVSTPVSLASGSTSSVGKASFSDVSIAKAIDDNSTAFINSLVVGKAIPSIEFKVYYSPAGVSTLYYSIKLTVAYLTSYQVNFADSAMEQLSFTGQTYTYTNWTKKTPQTFSWNVSTNSLGSK
ncbi:MAG: type VI secretion system tube protein Hcp [Janthinobacterium lividum]